MLRGADTGGTMIRSLLSCLLMLQVLLFSLQVATVQARADAATEYQIQTFPLERNGIALHLQRLAVAGTQPQRQILLVHGLTYSSHEFDVNYADYSLARYLAARGFAVWTFDVAGYGDSQVNRTLDTLPLQTRNVFRMSRYENKSIKEIADTLNISVKGVDYHIGKALKALRVNLKDYLYLFFI